MTGRDRPRDDSLAPPAIRSGKSTIDDGHAERVFAQTQPWWSQVRLTRKPSAEHPRLRQRRRGPASGDPQPPLAPFRIPTPRRIGGSLLLAIGYSLVVWAALFLIADALGHVI